MKTALTIQEKLKDLRVERGLTLDELAGQTSISKSALGSYETDEYKDISHYRVVTLAKFYGVSADYLLGITENKGHPNVDIAELHLSDEMIELLKSGKIHTRLLCEMAVHEGVAKLLDDIEIYVDGIASMQIQNLNAVVDVAREQIMKKYMPGEDDPHMRLLEAAHISEDEYFKSMVHGDIDSIIQDIKEAHKGDSESAPDTAVADKLKKSMEKAASFKGSLLEKHAVIFCEQLGIDYKRLTHEEFHTLIDILNKSKHLKSPIRQRGKRKKR